MEKTVADPLLWGLNRPALSAEARRLRGRRPRRPVNKPPLTGEVAEHSDAREACDDQSLLARPEGFKPLSQLR